ncbi:LuxR family transcriptional regulator [Pseudomonas azotoformans]|uniref:LuxR family transcriptional regulator n=1 Tax=Pseudomonas azotoformans TaxID=47878 RepID=A0A1V2J6C2_PSEAZ|nr:LuxR family transcriptional regulator [Pseudomonas azotoformans]OIN50064.1 LuxR family transcriptional regulator [Pseudomonas azotoformans]ONH40968.1 LuxR family transcriptional regulator [Pseudomonas azotoformans]SDO04464.1 LuxR family transcriptional regulator [Pseudomonas azotoformans]
MLNWRNKRLSTLEGENEVISVFELTVNKTYELGFQNCSFKMSSQLPKSQIKPIEFTNYSNEWKKLYDQAHYFDVDPVVKHCKECVLPIVWQEETFKDVPSLWSLAQTLGVHKALTISVHDFRGVFSMLTLSRGKGDISPEELYEKAGMVLWLCHAMHAVLAQKFAEKPSVNPVNKLTPRETEVLMWSGKGKTAADIAAILCLSERTVGFHVCSCLKKLGVNNKIAAVLRAAQEGII